MIGIKTWIDHVFPIPTFEWRRLCRYWHSYQNALYSVHTPTTSLPHPLPSPDEAVDSWYHNWMGSQIGRLNSKFPAEKVSFSLLFLTVAYHASYSVTEKHGWICRGARFSNILEKKLPLQSFEVHMGYCFIWNLLRGEKGVIHRNIWFFELSSTSLSGWFGLLVAESPIVPCILNVAEHKY